MHSSRILISTADRERLLRLIDSARLDLRISTASIASLEGELARADIVEAAELPSDVVTMGSTIWFRDLETDEVEQYTLVIPAEADVMRDRISILAPIGTALLGYRLGDVVEWRVPSGKRRMEIVKVNQRRHAAKPSMAYVGV
ncbi:nucleoside diphosphate kinase regulator [Anatilimnocola sp. NA78]|uniref:nucleoside diphosphate kinase regulator n=1 Tax=Anatilimnocola sp. NA78 TaxID=3415683 RepID=UPI003CE57DB2